MKMMIFFHAFKKEIGVGLFFFLVHVVSAQEVLLHSHNDYHGQVPFYQAYALQFATIEADIYWMEQEGELRVAHDREELPTAPTLDESYIEPLVFLFRQHGGRAWKNSDKTLSLMIDLKTPINPTLDRLLKKLQQYPDVFDPTVNPLAVRVIITGQQPDPEKFADYPAIISFDGSTTDYSPKALKRITLISLNLRNYTKWNGIGEMDTADYEKVTDVIAKVHVLGKPIRFWGTPDGDNAWKTFHSMGVDYINTDTPAACTVFFRNLLKEKD